MHHIFKLLVNLALDVLNLTNVLYPVFMIVSVSHIPLYLIFSHAGHLLNHYRSPTVTGHFQVRACMWGQNE